MADWMIFTYLVKKEIISFASFSSQLVIIDGKEALDVVSI